MSHPADNGWFWYIQAGTTTPDLSRPGSNDNKSVHRHSPELKRWNLTTRCSSVSYSCDPSLFGITPLQGMQFVLPISRLQQRMDLVWYLCLMASQPSRVIQCFVEEKQWFYSNYSLENKTVHAFPEVRKGMWHCYIVQNTISMISPSGETYTNTHGIMITGLLY